MEAVATSRSDIVGDAGVTKSNAALTQSADGKTVSPLDFDPSLTEDERRFYTKAYPTVDVVRDRKVHCTVCKMHIGTAPAQESIIKMHPVLRVTHCTKCHDFYNSGEFSKGEDGSELYCRWCGQGGEVYCCSNCPYVFCKSCIVKNLSRGVVADIEQNENWSCFNCAPKILWPLRAQHWALINYIEKQKKVITDMNVTEAEMKKEMAKDRSNCCRLAKAKCGNMSDSMESIDSIASRRSQSSASSAKKSYVKPTSSQTPPAKRAKTSNDEVVCTPDLMSMLEPDCQITLSLKSRLPQAPQASSTPNPKPIGAQAGYGQHSTAPVSSAPPPLVLRNTGIQLRHPTPAPIVRRTVVGPRTPTPGSGATTPVYHTINGYRIDLNSAAQQETFRLPNGKLIQVKRQGTQHQVNVNPHQLGWQQRTAAPVQQPTRPIQITQTSSQPRYVTVSPAQQSHPQIVRYHNTMVGNTTVTPLGHNGAQSQIQVINGAAQAPTAVPAVRPPVMVRHVFPNTAIGQARTQLQDQVFNAMEICQHLTGKVQTLTNSNAYKQARNYLEVKELYIHLSYLLTYAIGRFKGLQDKCLGDMRQLGFVNDADSLENGQLAADKQASDDEDNEIEIVEPKTDTITLDSDNEDEPPIKNVKSEKDQNEATTTPVPAQNSPVKSGIVINSSVTTTNDDVDFRLATQSILASMFEVDLSESEQLRASPGDSTQKKQPRKKTTNKPNPTLIKQKQMLERERLEEMKRSDMKLKMKCAIELKKAEDEFPFAKEMLNEKEAEMKEKEERAEKANTSTDEITVEVEVLLIDELDSFGEEEKDKRESQNAVKKKCENGRAEEENKTQYLQENIMEVGRKVNNTLAQVEDESEKIISNVIDKKTKTIAEEKETDCGNPKGTMEDKKGVDQNGVKNNNAVEDVNKEENLTKYHTQVLVTEKEGNDKSADAETACDTKKRITKKPRDVEKMIVHIEEIGNKLNKMNKITETECVSGKQKGDPVETGEEPDFDVDKEIADLLNKGKETAILENEITDVEKVQNVPIVMNTNTNTGTKEVRGDAATVETTSSPNIFNDINELIEKENNAMT